MEVTNHEDSSKAGGYPVRGSARDTVRLVPLGCPCPARGSSDCKRAIREFLSGLAIDNNFGCSFGDGFGYGRPCRWIKLHPYYDMGIGVRCYSNNLSEEPFTSFPFDGNPPSVLSQTADVVSQQHMQPGSETAARVREGSSLIDEPYDYCKIILWSTVASVTAKAVTIWYKHQWRGPSRISRSGHVMNDFPQQQESVASESEDFVHSHLVCPILADGVLFVLVCCKDFSISLVRVAVSDETSESSECVRGGRRYPGSRVPCSSKHRPWDYSYQDVNSELFVRCEKFYCESSGKLSCFVPKPEGDRAEGDGGGGMVFDPPVCVERVGTSGSVWSRNLRALVVVTTDHGRMFTLRLNLQNLISDDEVRDMLQMKTGRIPATGAAPMSSRGDQEIHEKPLKRIRLQRNAQSSLPSEHQRMPEGDKARPCLSGNLMTPSDNWWEHVPLYNMFGDRLMPGHKRSGHIELKERVSTGIGGGDSESLVSIGDTNTESSEVDSTDICLSPELAHNAVSGTAGRGWIPAWIQGMFFRNSDHKQPEASQTSDRSSVKCPSDRSITEPDLMHDRDTSEDVSPVDVGTVRMSDGMSPQARSSVGGRGNGDSTLALYPGGVTGLIVVRCDSCANSREMSCYCLLIRSRGVQVFWCRGDQDVMLIREERFEDELPDLVGVVGGCLVDCVAEDDTVHCASADSDTSSSRRRHGTTSASCNVARADGLCRSSEHSHERSEKKLALLLLQSSPDENKLSLLYSSAFSCRALLADQPYRRWFQYDGIILVERVPNVPDPFVSCLMLTETEQLYDADKRLLSEERALNQCSRLPVWTSLSYCCSGIVNGHLLIGHPCFSSAAVTDTAATSKAVRDGRDGSRNRRLPLDKISAGSDGRPTQLNWLKGIDVAESCVEGRHWCISRFRFEGDRIESERSRTVPTPLLGLCMQQRLELPLAQSKISPLLSRLFASHCPQSSLTFPWEVYLVTNSTFFRQSFTGGRQCVARLLDSRDIQQNVGLAVSQGTGSHGESRQEAGASLRRRSANVRSTSGRTNTDQTQAVLADATGAAGDVEGAQTHASRIMANREVMRMKDRLCVEHLLRGYNAWSNKRSEAMASELDSFVHIATAAETSHNKTSERLRAVANLETYLSRVVVGQIGWITDDTVERVKAKHDALLFRSENDEPGITLEEKQRRLKEDDRQQGMIDSVLVHNSLENKKERVFNFIEFLAQSGLYEYLPDRSRVEICAMMERMSGIEVVRRHHDLSPDLMASVLYATSCLISKTNPAVSEGCLSLSDMCAGADLAVTKQGSADRVGDSEQGRVLRMRYYSDVMLSPLVIQGCADVGASIGKELRSSGISERMASTDEGAGENLIVVDQWMKNLGQSPDSECENLVSEVIRVAQQIDRLCDLVVAYLEAILRTRKELASEFQLPWNPIVVDSPSYGSCLPEAAPPPQFLTSVWPTEPIEIPSESLSESRLTAPSVYNSLSEFTSSCLEIFNYIINELPWSFLVRQLRLAREARAERRETGDLIWLLARKRRRKDARMPGGFVPGVIHGSDVGKVRQLFYSKDEGGGEWEDTDWGIGRFFELVHRSIKKCLLVEEHILELCGNMILGRECITTDEMTVLGEKHIGKIWALESLSHNVRYHGRSQRYVCHFYRTLQAGLRYQHVPTIVQVAVTLCEQSVRCPTEVAREFITGGESAVADSQMHGVADMILYRMLWQRMGEDRLKDDGPHFERSSHKRLTGTYNNTAHSAFRSLVFEYLCSCDYRYMIFKMPYGLTRDICR
eukprot:GHVQ01002479.1.p1 GENE.GHVQ01002479.1~~GHVQ01002479.1.p1  ORF type:complete len:1768 (+),score=203.86 GHVQ01002479.1:124-5427(+)